MRVVHVSPTDVDGGAAKGTHNLHMALRRAGIDSLMLVQRKYGDDPATLVARGDSRGIVQSGIRDQLDRLPLKLYPNRGDGWWTVGWLPFDILPTIERLKPDIVQFHWSGRGAAPIGILPRLTEHGYPVAWTLRDMWPLTGGCHYADSCERFLQQCGRCPQLGGRLPYDISRWQWRRKYRAWRDAEVAFIAMSEWMADYARRSPLTFDNEVSVIPNGIDVETFHPVDRAFARSVWNIPQDKRVILFGALNATTDRRKGFAYLDRALARLAEQGRGEDTIAVVFGAGGGAPDVHLPTRYVGRVHDEVTLAMLYACADVMVTPSVQENFGKTAIEAMACGVPVVAFANTGQVDIIDHKLNGYLAEDLSADDLAAGIDWVLDRVRGGDDRLARAARAKVERCFDMREIAGRHIVLYQSMLGSRQGAMDAEPAGREEPAVAALDVSESKVVGAS